MGRQVLAHGYVLGDLEGAEGVVLVLLVHHPGGPVDERLDCLVVGGHLREVELDPLVLCQGLLEGAPLLDVVHPEVQGPLRCAHAAGRDEDPGGVEALHREVEAPPLVPDLVLPGYLDVGHLESARAYRHPAQVVEALRDLHPGGVEGEVEGRHASMSLGPVVVPRDEVASAQLLALGRPADVGLLPVHDPAVIRLLEGRLEGRDVGPSARLRDPYADEGVARHGLPQAVVPDRVRAVFVDHVAPACLHEEEDWEGDRDVGVSQLLGRYRRRHPVGSGPSVLLGQRHAEEAEVPDALDQALGELVSLVVLPDLLYGEVLGEPLPHGLPEELLLVRERKIYHFNFHLFNHVPLLLKN